MTYKAKIFTAFSMVVVFTILIVLGLGALKKNNKTASTETKPANGPYYHQVYSAVSTDGLTWTKNNELLFDHASVPGAVIKDNKIYLYFVDASENDDQLSVAISSDNGKTFTKQQEVKIKNVDKSDAVDPHPELVDGKIRLYYLGDFTSLPKDKSKKATIYSAESSDGINFENVKSAYQSESQGVITDPDVIKSGSEWLMLVSKGTNLDLVVSQDNGVSFTKQSNFSWTEGGVTDTFNFNNTFRTYACGQGGITSATGLDKKKLSKEEGVRIAEETGKKIVCDPSVIQLPDKSYLMFYKTQEITQQQNQGTQQFSPGQTGNTQSSNQFQEQGEITTPKPMSSTPQSFPQQ